MIMSWQKEVYMTELLQKSFKQFDEVSKDPDLKYLNKKGANQFEWFIIADMIGALLEDKKLPKDHSEILSIVDMLQYYG